MLPMYREPCEKPAFGVWLNKFCQVIDGDEGLRKLFGDVTNLFSPIPSENRFYAVPLFWSLVNGRLSSCNVLMDGITANGGRVTFRVRAEVVAITKDDVWVSMHGWTIRSLENERKQRG